MRTASAKIRRADRSTGKHLLRADEADVTAMWAGFSVWHLRLALELLERDGQLIHGVLQLGDPLELYLLLSLHALK